MSEPNQKPPVHHEIDYEETDARLGVVIGSILGLIGLTLVAMLASLWLFNALDARRDRVDATPLPLINLRATPPAPRLQPNPIDNETAEEDLAGWLAHEREVLGSYGWVDEDAGKVRIPITRAMEILVVQINGE